MSSRFRVVATDVDGTLTIDRSSLYIEPGVISCLRALEDRGFVVVLVSANALPVVVALKRYFGLRSPVIGENGAFVFFSGSRVVELSRISARRVLDDVLDRFRDYVESSWQNMFRHHDYALKVRRKYRGRAWSVYEMIKDYVEKKYSDVHVSFSGYAIHLTPVDTSKARALEYLVDKLGYSLGQVVAIADSIVDLELCRIAGYCIAVGNADKELKEEADYITREPSGRGFIEFCKKLLQDTNYL